MSKIKFWNSVYPSGPLVIQNIEQGFVPLQKQYQLRYSVRYSILAEHSNLQHLLLYRIFSATREQGPTGTRYPTRTRNIFQYPIRTRLIFKIIGYFGYRVLEKNQVFDMNP